MGEICVCVCACVRVFALPHTCIINSPLECSPPGTQQVLSSMHDAGALDKFDDNDAMIRRQVLVMCAYAAELGQRRHTRASSRPLQVIKEMKHIHRRPLACLTEIHIHLSLTPWGIYLMFYGRGRPGAILGSLIKFTLISPRRTVWHSLHYTCVCRSGKSRGALILAVRDLPSLEALPWWSFS